MGAGGQALRFAPERAEEPGHAGKVQSADGQWWELTGHRVDLRCLGAVGDGVASDQVAVQSWFAYCNEKKCVGTVSKGTYLVDAIVQVFTGDARFEFSPDSLFIGSEAGGASSVIRLDGGVTRGRLLLSGIRVDNSRRAFISADASGTALSLLRFDGYRVEFGAFLSTDYRDLKGDSGITTNQCTGGVITQCLFKGQPDLGVYLTGGPSAGPEDDYGSEIIENCIFLRCAGAGSTKRQNRRTVFRNNFVLECRTGFSNQEAVSSGATIAPAREMLVDGNFFKRIGSRAINAKPGSIIFTNNIVEDWGYDPEGILNSGGDAGFSWAVRWQTSRSVCTGNVFRFRDWSGAGMTGVYVDRVTIDGVIYNPVGNLLDGNTFGPMERGIQEAAGAAGNHGANLFDTVTTPITYTSGGGSHFDTLLPSGVRNIYASALTTGKTTQAVAGFGAVMLETGTIGAHTDTATPMYARRTGDGNCFVFYDNTTSIGGVANVGGVLSYNTFLGSHWSQFNDGSKRDLLLGTVLETTGELCEWPGEQAETRLVRIKVSDTPNLGTSTASSSVGMTHPSRTRRQVRRARSRPMTSTSRP